MIMIIIIVIIIIIIIVLVLPGFSKFLERIIYNHLYDYLTNSHLCNNQFGFRKNTLRRLPWLICMKKTSSVIDRVLAVGVSLDLWKAFDTVNHSNLFDKLEHNGISGLSLKWIKRNFSTNFNL